MTFSLRQLPPWALYGGAGVALGGGYLLYRRHQASVAGAQSGSTSTATPTTLDTSGVTATGGSAQQSSIVPYYLSADQAATSGPRRRTPQPVGASVPSGSSATGTSGAAGSQLPAIPPLLPTATSQPAATATTPPPAAPAPAAPAPAPAQNNNIPSDLLAKITANGERIIGGIPAPGGGMWWLGSKGGVFAINAPFYGAPAGQSYWGSRTAVSIVPNGKGYNVIDTAGEVYQYPG